MSNDIKIRCPKCEQPLQKDCIVGDFSLDDDSDMNLGCDNCGHICKLTEAKFTVGDLLYLKALIDADNNKVN